MFIGLQPVFELLNLKTNFLRRTSSNNVIFQYISYLVLERHLFEQCDFEKVAKLSAEKLLEMRKISTYL